MIPSVVSLPSLPESFYVYRAPIDSSFFQGRDLPLYLDSSSIFGRVFVNKTAHFTEVEGIPKTLFQKEESLKKFLSNCYFVIRKDDQGSPIAISPRLKVKGGGQAIPGLIPVKPGYSLGTVLLKVDVDVEIYERELVACIKKKEGLQELKQDLTEKIEEILKEDKGSEKSVKASSSKFQVDLNDLNRRIVENEIDHDRLLKRLEKLVHKQNKIRARLKTVTKIERVIPFDYLKVYVTRRGFESEVMSSYIFNIENLSYIKKSENKQKQIGGEEQQANYKKDPISGRKETINKIREFVARLSKGAEVPAYINQDLFYTICDAIESTVDEQTEAILCGSLINMSRVRSLDPKIQKNFTPSGGLDKSKLYCVITEVFLGGLFLGVGQSFGSKEQSSYKSVEQETISGSGSSSSSDSQKNSEALKKTLLSSVAVNYVSQGAIPDVTSSGGRVDLWTVYSSWKKGLVKDEWSGFPIGFKYRPLRPILAENNIPLGKSDDESWADTSDSDGS